MQMTFNPGKNKDKNKKELFSKFKKQKTELPVSLEKKSTQIEPVIEEIPKQLSEQMIETKCDKDYHEEESDAKMQEKTSYSEYPNYYPGYPEYPDNPNPNNPHHPGYKPDHKCLPYPYPGYYYPLQCLGYAYIPWQAYLCTYSPGEAFKKGTMFPELFSPYYPDKKPPVVPRPYLNFWQILMPGRRRLNQGR